MKHLYKGWGTFARTRSIRRNTLTALAAIGFFSWSIGQVSSYGFVQSSGTYTPISGGTVLGTSTNDDNNFTSNPIGFTFNYNGTNYTQFSANANGFIAMGTAITSSYTALSTGGTNNVIAAISRDIQSGASG